MLLLRQSFQASVWSVAKNIVFYLFDFLSHFLVSNSVRILFHIGNRENLNILISLLCLRDFFPISTVHIHSSLMIISADFPRLLYAFTFYFEIEAKYRPSTHQEPRYLNFDLLNWVHENGNCSKTLSAIRSSKVAKCTGRFYIVGSEGFQQMH